MNIITIALAMSSIAVISGILAIGSGRHWRFNTRDYFLGKKSAVLYLWVVTSTIFSILLSGAIAQYGLDTGWVEPHGHIERWMWIHAVMASLLTAAHFFVRYTLSKDINLADQYLWGKNSL